MRETEKCQRATIFTHSNMATFLIGATPGKVHFVSHEGGISRHIESIVKTATQQRNRGELTTCCAAENRSKLAEINRKRASGCNI